MSETTVTRFQPGQMPAGVSIEVPPGAVLGDTVATFDATGIPKVAAWLRKQGISSKRATLEQLAEAFNATGAVGGSISVATGSSKPGGGC